MIVKILLLFATVGSCLAADCISSSGQRCLTKREVGGFYPNMTNGDPCFLLLGYRVKLSAF